MATNKPQAECYCPECGWSGHWEDAVHEEEREKVDYMGTWVSRTTHLYFCPECGEEVMDGSTEYVTFGGGG